jgi:hypothetical protein
MPSHIRCYSLHPLNCSSSHVAFELYSIVCILVPLFRFQSSQFYCFIFRNMATFHVISRLNLTIMVDELGLMSISEHYLCVMFVF